MICLAFRTPCLEFSLQRCLVADASIQALMLGHADFDLLSLRSTPSGQPAAGYLTAFGSAMFSQLPCLGEPRDEVIR
ncbi:MAG: hypothetical protein IAE77_19020 [Prosthecobacter sp.]|jgi:hypothetical protein|nr:hypothetical protein [Prosthecobacter sp.]